MSFARARQITGFASHLCSESIHGSSQCTRALQLEICVHFCLCCCVFYVFCLCVSVFVVNGDVLGEWGGEARMFDVFVLLAHTLPTYLRPVSR